MKTYTLLLDLSKNHFKILIYFKKIIIILQKEYSLQMILSEN